MKIDLKKLTGAAVGAIPFEETLDLREETLYGAKPFQTPVEVQGTVSNELGVLRLRGSAKTIYATGCARCLKPLQIPLSAEVDVILSSDPNAEEDDDLFIVKGDSVDTAEVMMPALFLQVEMTYLCKEDCKGLCPHCGADLNETTCSCETKQIDPRFAALRALLDRKEEQS